jgi:hypothetical protein
MDHVLLRQAYDREFEKVDAPLLETAVSIERLSAYRPAQLLVVLWRTRYLSVLGVGRSVR